MNCNHHKIWHEKKHTSPPTDSYLQFCSSRESARIPTYVSDINFVEIFIPEAIPIVEAIEIPDSSFCPNFETLPA